MLFNSLDFAVFLPIVFFLYWFVTKRNLRLQNFLIVVASYVFYGWWDWRFLSLLFVSSLIDYAVGRALELQDDKLKRKLLVSISFIVNLGLLGFFKYCNFFIGNFQAAFTLFGTHLKPNMLHVILPVGLSFYTFQTLSYAIDVYRKKLTPTKDFIAFSAFVSFFPQLVAGPIERARQLLPQFQKERTFDYHTAVDGMRQILWGLFKQIVIADNCADYANMIFDHSGSYSGTTLVMGALFFTFQIYGDFSGYSDIAIGTARLFGIDLMRNFAFPYFSRDIAEFWRRWHISLSTWFREYLYLPLGGSKGGLGKTIRNTFIIFLVSGFWHGANWTFIAWGLLNAIYFLPLLITGRNREHLGTVAEGRLRPSIKEFSQMLLTFALTVFAWIFFRAENIGHAFGYISSLISGLFDPSAYAETLFLLTNKIRHTTKILLVLFIVVEWLGRNEQYAIAALAVGKPRAVRYAFYYAVILSIFWYGGKEQQFIYFQF